MPEIHRFIEVFSEFLGGPADLAGLCAPLCLQNTERISGLLALRVRSQFIKSRIAAFDCD
jgi:hypothetical protein